MDSKGSATIELGIILIISILIIGITLTSFENATDKIIESQKDENIEMLISEVADNLINNPGKPENWPEIKKGTPATIQEFLFLSIKIILAIIQIL